jgi:CheY-like chemotaxis protein
VILDIMMPIVDGRQVLEVMKQDAQLADIPVIVVSATPRERLVGASAFIQKPIPLGTLFEMVRAFTATPPAAAPPPARPVSS